MCFCCSMLGLLTPDWCTGGSRGTYTAYLRARWLPGRTAWSTSTTSMCFCAVHSRGRHGMAYAIHMMRAVAAAAAAAAAGCHVDHRAIDQFATGDAHRSVRSRMKCDQSTARHQNRTWESHFRPGRCLTHVSLGPDRCVVPRTPRSSPTYLPLYIRTSTHHPPPTCVPRMCTSAVNSTP